MNGLVVLVLAAAALLAAAIWFYNNAEDTVYHKVRGEFQEWKAKYESEKKTLVDKVAELQTWWDAEKQKSIALQGEYSSLEAKYSALEKKYEVIEREIKYSNRLSKDAVKECDQVQTHYGKIRDDLQRLEKAVIKKRTIVKWEGPIPMQIIPGGKKAGGVTDKTKRKTKEKK